MICTIMSDCSVCPDTGASGYGLWIKSNRGHFRGNGNYRKKTTDTTEAEGKAIYNALYLAFQYGLAQPGDKLILQIDNKYFIQAVGHEYHKGNKHVKSIANKFRAFIKKTGCEYEMRHVKAHNPELGNRNYVNEICDGLAKEAMRRERAKLRSAA